MREEIFNMTQKEITRFRVINQTIDKVLTIKEAAELLNLSECQVIRLKKGVVSEGPAFIIHKNRGKKPAHAVLYETKSKIIKLNRQYTKRLILLIFKSSLRGLMASK